MFYVKHKIITALDKLFYVSSVEDIMENIRHRGILKFIRGFITFALYTEIAAAVVIIVMLGITIGTDEGPALSAWPVTTGADFAGEQVSISGSGPGDLKVSINQGSIHFSAESFIYYLLKVVDAIFILSLVIWITILLRRVFRSLDKPHPFVAGNAQRLRQMAFLIMLITPYSIIKSLAYRSYIQNNIVVDGMEYADLSGFLSKSMAPGEIWLDLNINAEALLAGLFLLIIAEIFRIGVLIKSDNDSIV